MKYLEILIKLRRIIRSINLESKKIEKEFGISIPQLLVMQYLDQQPDKCASGKDIKLYINLNASTVSGILVRLENKLLIKRVSSKNDRRSSLVALTEEGKHLLTQSPTTLQEKLSKKLDQLTPERIKELEQNIELLTKIMDLDNIDAAPLLTINMLPNDPN